MIQPLKLYLLERKDSGGHDSFDSALICAINEEDAKSIHPNGQDFSKTAGRPNSWVEKTSLIIVTEIGTPNSNQVRGVIIASFNAG